MAIWTVLLAALLLPASIAAQQAVATWQAVPDLRLGSRDDQAQTLTMVNAIAIGPQGQILVGQPRDGLIRVFDRTGNALQPIGRRGQGPGEFQMVSAFGFLHDTLWVSDGRGHRVTLFNGAGRFLAALTMLSPASGPLLSSVPFQLLPDGSGLARQGVVAQSVADGTVSTIPVLRIGRSGRILDTLLMVPLENSQVSIAAGNSRFFARQFFADDPLHAFTADGSEFAVVERKAATTSAVAAIRVTRMRSSGDTIYAREYGYTPKLVDQARVDSMVERMARSFMDFQRPMFASIAAGEEALRRALYLPRFEIPVTAALFAEDGALWLGRGTDSNGRQRWERHDNQGRLTAEVSLPGRATVHVIQRDAIWAAEPDDLDVPFVVRYLLKRTSQRDQRPPWR